MNSDDAQPKSRKGLVAVLAVVIIAFPLGYSVASSLLSARRVESPPLLEAPEHADEGCIRDIEYMRFRHMDLLTEMRDAGVRGGARREVSFSDCTRCHTSREGFCNRCHDAVNLHPDCFECHHYP
jgi:hypothetical protein